MPPSYPVDLPQPPAREVVAAPGLRWRAVVAGFWLQLTLPVEQLLVVVGVIQPAAFVAVLTSAAGTDQLTDVETTQIAFRAALTALWGATVWGTGGILRSDAIGGTLAMLVVRPADPRLILLGRSVGNAVRIGVIVVVVSLASIVLLGRRPVVGDVPMLVVALLLMMATAVATGLLLSTVFFVVREANRVQEVLMYPVYLLGGLLVPLSVLPPALQPLSTVISFRWVAEITSAATTNSQPPLVAVVLATALTGGYLTIGWTLFGAVLRRNAARGGVPDG